MRFAEDPEGAAQKKPRQGSSSSGRGGGHGGGRGGGRGGGQGQSRRSGEQRSSAGNGGITAQPSPSTAGVLEEAAEGAGASVAATVRARTDGRPARQAALSAKRVAAWKK